MKKKILIFLAIPFILLILFTVKEQLIQSYAENEIDKANYCSVKEDCIATRWCRYINIRKEGQVDRVLDIYDKTITNKLAIQCKTIKNLQCANNKCQPQLAD